MKARGSFAKTEIGKATTGNASLRLPPLVSEQDRSPGTSTCILESWPHRSYSRKADGNELGAPSPESDEDDDIGPSEKSLDLAVLEVKNAVNHFAQALISDMTRLKYKYPEELELFKQMIRREVKAEVDSKNHWKFLVQGFVGERLFEDFDIENGFFGIEYFDGLKSSPFLSFADFCKFKDKAATLSELLAKDSVDLSFLGKFCFQKFKSVSGYLATNCPLPIYQEEWSTISKERHPKSDFYQCFLKAAVSVWLLHRLVHSFKRGWKMLGWETYPKGSKFQRELMEPVIPRLLGEENEDTDLDIVVGFLVLPGFQMSNSVVKCEVYPSYMSAHQLGRLDTVQTHPVPNLEDCQDRPASSSYGYGNTLESSSQEFSYGSTSTPVWSSSTSSGSGIRFSNLKPTYNARNSSRPHEISEPFQAYKSSITLEGSPQDISEPLPMHSSSWASSGSWQGGPSEASPIFKPSDSIIEDVVKTFTWDQVLNMINGPTCRQLGKGGFGTVYLGKLENGKEVAVKILDRSSQQGTPEFLNEVNLLRRVNHVNLVRLRGYCQDKEQVLIYEFAEEGSIWDHLHGERKWLDWKQRLSIALQSACGLEYLHTLCSPRIIHRDIKSENILLTKTMVAKVSDFGLSRLGADQDNNWKTHVTTKVMGTRGYLDPEYHLTAQLRDSSDVYSFGIVLLEIVTGRKPVPNSDPKCCITNWVEKTYGSGGSRAVKAVADPLFSDNYDPRALKLVINVARSCIKSSGESRPKISEVVRVLREAQMFERGEKKSWFSFL